jgi:hypothetical protein
MILSRLTRTLTISETRRNYQNDKNTSSIPQKKLKATTDCHLVTCTCSDIDTNTRLGTDHLTWRGGYGFLFRSEFFFGTIRELEYYFFPEFNIRFYDKNSESDYFFFPPPKSEYFFQQHWKSEYFFRKKAYIQVKWSFF